MTQWEPIETAPKDGCDFLGYSNDHGQRIAYWASWRDNIRNEDKEGWRDTWSLDKLPTLTHWQPLPMPPYSREGRS